MEEQPVIGSRALPDMRICRAKDMGGAYPRCLVKHPANCPYAVPFGRHSFCVHPEYKRIIRRTDDAEEPGPGS